MKMTKTLIAITFSAFALGAHAEGSVHHSGQASKHSALAVSEGVASTASVASAAVAVPLVVVGGASVIAGSAAAELSDHAAKNHIHHHGPLVITETTVTVDPAPNQVIVINKNSDN